MVYVSPAVNELPFAAVKTAVIAVNGCCKWCF